VIRSARQAATPQRQVRAGALAHHADAGVVDAAGVGQVVQPGVGVPRAASCARRAVQSGASTT
jgi:hypothetical protein